MERIIRDCRIYSHTQPYKSVVYNQDPSTDIVCETPINVKRSESFYTMLGYNRRMFSGKLYFSGNLYINFPKYKYIFLNKTIKYTIRFIQET